MSQYTEIEIAQIVSDCEILTQPDGGLNDEGGYTSEASEASTRELNIPKNYLYSRHFSSDVNAALIQEAAAENDEDFEKVFELSKLKRQIVNVSCY